MGVVADALGGEVTLITPDLRGRGRSNGLPGPFGIAQHADDLAMVLDAIGAEQVVVAGHSMGGFIAAMFAVRHAARAGALVLVDGGPPFQAPPGDTIEEQLNTFLGPSMARLDMTFESREAYTRFWEQHPSFPDSLPPLVDAQAQHDLVGEPPELRSSCNKAAIREDGTELTASEYARSAIYKVGLPVHAAVGAARDARPGGRDVRRRPDRGAGRRARARRQPLLDPDGVRRPARGRRDQAGLCART